MRGIFHFCAITLLALFTCSSCQNMSQNVSLDKSTNKSDSIEIYHTIVSDDSLVTAIWHDTGSNEYAHDIVAFEIRGDSLRYLYNYKID